MGHFIFNKERMDFRYSAGTVMYSEKLLDGRLMSMNYNATGMPAHDHDCVMEAPVNAFELVIDGKDASFGWEFEAWNTSKDASGRDCAEIVLKNPKLSLQLRVQTLCGDNGFFSRHLYIKNLSDKPQSITKIQPLCGTLWEKKHDVKDSLGDYDESKVFVGCFKDNHWGAEGNFDWYNVPYNAWVSFGGENGRSGHGHPFAIARNDVMGGYFVCQMEWGANWNFAFKNDFRNFAGTDNNGLKPYLRVKFHLEPVCPAPMRVLAAGEEVEAPRVHFGFSYNDFDDTIYALHTYQRKYLLMRPTRGYDMISYDHWGYMEHEMTEEKLLIEVERAAKLGAEIFVVDAGWYGRADKNFWLSVGDWHMCHLENDLHPVVKRAKELGLKFGLWVEPEAWGIDSLAREAHPEWLLQRYGHGIERVLDLSHPEAEKYIEDVLCSLVEKYDLDMIRLDYNNGYIGEGGFNENGDYLENSHWRNVEAIHRIFDNIHKKHPDLHLENCASGGGRTDLGMMTRFSKTQFSDWYKFPRIAKTFNGMSMCLPPECLMFIYGSAMSASSYGNAESQLQMTIQGIPQLSGYARYEEEGNPALEAMIQKYLKIHKEFIRPIHHDVKIYHHTPVVGGFSGRGWVVNEAMLPDGTKGYVNINRLPGCEEDTWQLRLKGCDCTKDYIVTDVASGKQFAVSGYDLYAKGMPITLDGALTSRMLLVEIKK